MELTLDEGYDTEYIPTIGLIALGVVDLANVVAWRGSTPTLRVDILSTEGELVLVVLGRETITVLLNAALLASERIEHLTA